MYSLKTIRMKRIIFYLSTISLFLPSCTGHVEKERVITVTIEPQRYFAEKLAGDHFKIITMVPPGTSPETYDPSPVQMAGLAKSTAYFQIGEIGFEQVWMEKIKENNPGLQVFNNGNGINYITGHACEHEEQGHGHDHAHSHPGGVDPHTWSSPKAALLIVENMFEAFCRLDSANTVSYRKNLESLKAEMVRTDQQVSEILSKATSRSFIIYHPALTYLAEDYQLNQLCIEIDGKEPSPEQLKHLIEECRSKQVKTVFVQQEFDKKNAEVLAKETGCKLVVINTLSYNWEDELIKIAKALADE